jgi:uncharacterized protein (DUF1778 family)
MKMGRPVKPDAEKKSSVTALRFKEEERAKLEKAAKQKDKKLADWMRETLLSSAELQLHT